MKKTLFLTMIAAAIVAPVHATVEGVQVDPGHGVYLSTDLTIDSTNVDDYLQPGTFGDAGASAGVVVGTSHGASTLTVVGVDVSTPNNLYISGNGGGDQKDQTSIPGVMNPGTVVLKEGATLTVSGVNSDWNGMQLQVGTSSTASQGTLKVESGSKLDAGPRVYVGAGASTGEMLITGTGSSATISTTRVGSSGAGVTLTAGSDAGTKGTVTVADGAHLSVTDNGTIGSSVLLGDKGVGVLNVTGAGTVFESNAPQFNLGYMAGAKGVVNVSDGATFSNASSRVLYVGYYGEGGFNVSNTKNVSTLGGLYVGFKAGSKGSINVDDNAAMTINSVGSLYLGYEGAAELNVGNGSTVTISGQVIAGTNAGGRGDINVTGGSTLKLSTNNLYLGNAAGSEGHLTVDSGSTVSITGLLSAGWNNTGSTIDNAGTISFGRGSTIRHGTVITNSGKLENKSTSYNITFMEGTQVDNSGEISSACGMKLSDRSELDNSGTITSHGSGFLITDADTTLSNTGVITADTCIAVDAGASLYNWSDIEIKKVNSNQSFYGFGIGPAATVFTGVVTVSGRESELQETSYVQMTAEQAVYDTHIKFTGFDEPVYDDQSAGTTVTLGAVIEGKDTMQHLFKQDWETINTNIKNGLHVTNTDVQFANVIGKNIAVHYTTDDVNVHESTVVALGAGTVLVDKGSEEVGTIGSYKENINESEANIRLDEKTDGSTVRWGGTTLKTVDTDKDTILRTHDKVDLTYVDGTQTGTGTLVVVKDTTLRSAGTVVGAVKVEDGGTLIVGNSPGSTTFGSAEIAGTVVFCVSGLDVAATPENNGWASGTYSQLVLKDGTGTLTVTETATIRIELGGQGILPVWTDKDCEFDLTLVTGINVMEVLGETFTGNSLTSTAVENLKGMTVFAMTAEALGLTDFDASTVLTPAEFTYTLEADGNGAYALHLKGRMSVPEPATATLSLLALAGLCARRRRK